MCFSLEALKDILIWIIVIGAVFAIIRLVVPMAATYLGGPGSVLVQVINIVLWAVLAIIVIIFAFQLISCLLGAGSLRIGR
jgi:hypothetical protein